MLSPLLTYRQGSTGSPKRSFRYICLATELPLQLNPAVSACQLSLGEPKGPLQKEDSSDDKCHFFMDPSVEISGTPNPDHRFLCLVLRTKTQETEKAEMRPLLVNKEVWQDEVYTRTKRTYRIPGISGIILGVRRITIGGIYFERNRQTQPEYFDVEVGVEN